MVHPLLIQREEPDSGFQDKIRHLCPQRNSLRCFMQNIMRQLLMQRLAVAKVILSHVSI
jgi:hypothetical protein